MPIYDYRCPVCGNVVEDWGDYNEAMKAKQCNSSVCKGEQQCFVRTIAGNAPAIILKGDCWEKDGYSGKSNKKE
jgi:putative FmdB family regulatory protein